MVYNMTIFEKLRFFTNLAPVMTGSFPAKKQPKYGFLDVFYRVKLKHHKICFSTVYNVTIFEKIEFSRIRHLFQQVSILAKNSQNIDFQTLDPKRKKKQFKIC